MTEQIPFQKCPKCGAPTLVTDVHSIIELCLTCDYRQQPVVTEFPKS